MWPSLCTSTTPLFFDMEFFLFCANAPHPEALTMRSCIEWDINAFAITRLKLFRDGFDVALLMHDNGAGPPIILRVNSEEKMQLNKVTHFKIVLEAIFQFIDDVHIVCQNDDVVHIYDYNHNVVVNL